MLRFVLLVLLASATGLAGAPAPLDKPDRSQELRAIQGEWEKITGGNARVTIKGDRFITHTSEWFTAERVRLDPSQNPKAIDFIKADGRRFYGIYRREGDTFTVCLNNYPGRLPRPVIVDGRADKDTFVLRRKR
jgi:uncharacterized protein (TIGR03067 family)